MRDVRALAALCAGLVRPGGAVVFTTMLGDRVHALLADVPLGGEWTARDGPAVRYAIRRKYRGRRLAEAGQEVGVKLPFSGGELYDEFLVNVDVFAREFGRRGLALEERRGFDEYFADFERERPELAAALTPDDRAYLALYGALVFRRAE